MYEKKRQISDLNENELESFINEYYNSSNSVKHIIEKYNLNIKAADIPKNIPSQKTTIICNSCSSYLEIKPKSRMVFKFNSVEEYICSSCGFIGSIQDNNKVKEEKIRKDKEEDYLRKIICYQEEKYESSYYCLIDITTRTIYLTLLKYMVSDKLGHFTNIASFEKNEEGIHFSPTHDMARELIDIIHHSGLLKFSQNENNIGKVFPINNEDWNDVSDFQYFPLSIQYMLNKKNFEVDWVSKEIEKCHEYNNIDNYNIDSVISLWRKIAYNELLEYLQYLIEHEHKIKSGLDYIGEAVKQSLYSILEYFSVSEGYSIIYSSMEKTAAYKQKNNITNKHAINLLPKLIETNISKRVSGEWNRNNFERNYNLSQSSFSLTFFYDILKIGDDGFRKSPKIENLVKNKQILDRLEYHKQENTLENHVYLLEQFYPNIKEIVDESRNTIIPDIASLFYKYLADDEQKRDKALEEMSELLDKDFSWLMLNLYKYQKDI